VLFTFIYARCEVFTPVKTQIKVFQVVIPCNVVVGYQCFGGPCCLHLQAASSWYPTTILQVSQPRRPRPEVRVSIYRVTIMLSLLLKHNLSLPGHLVHVMNRQSLTFHIMSYIYDTAWLGHSHNNPCLPQ
jgi:peptidoglycan biosynthesis protein MviN/MurJ (putative lipid II flippase)